MALVPPEEPPEPGAFKDATVRLVHAGIALTAVCTVETDSFTQVSI
jgi:hypothetical protein